MINFLILKNGQKKTQFKRSEDSVEMKIVCMSCRTETDSQTAIWLISVFKSFLSSYAKDSPQTKLLLKRR